MRITVFKFLCCVIWEVSADISVEPAISIVKVDFLVVYFVTFVSIPDTWCVK